jgi:hypothetical protein
MIAADFVHDPYCTVLSASRLGSALSSESERHSGDLPLGTGPLIAVYNSPQFLFAFELTPVLCCSL